MQYPAFWQSQYQLILFIGVNRRIQPSLPKACHQIVLSSIAVMRRLETCCPSFIQISGKHPDLIGFQ
jgi:hypothetical protein